MSTIVFRNIAQIATLNSAFDKDGRHLKPEDLGLIKDAAIVFDDMSIIWVGLNKDLPESFNKTSSVDMSQKVVVPEIVDCHTHLIFGGDRSTEYSQRINGVNYQEIANSGGGILSTMKGTNELATEELFELAKIRIERIHSYGVGTVEIKSGYGLNFKKEFEISYLIDDLKNHFKDRVQIVNTCMAAHAVPPDAKSSENYLKEVVFPLVEQLSYESIVDAIDIFHEQNYFTSNDVEELFKYAQRFHLPVKIHADEFMDNNGAKLATQYNALSADHLLRTSDEGIQALAKSQTVATLLPGTGFFLGKEPANARKFLDSGVKVAIASDYNPGSCHCDNVLLLASLAAPTYKMNMAELWSAITLNAAAALNLNNQGALVVGLKPRFSIFNTKTVDSITYNWGRNLAEYKVSSF